MISRDTVKEAVLAYIDVGVQNGKNTCDTLCIAGKKYKLSHYTPAHEGDVSRARAMKIWEFKATTFWGRLSEFCGHLWDAMVCTNDEDILKFLESSSVVPVEERASDKGITKTYPALGLTNWDLLKNDQRRYQEYKNNIQKLNDVPFSTCDNFNRRDIHSCIITGEQLDKHNAVLVKFKDGMSRVLSRRGIETTLKRSDKYSPLINHETLASARFEQITDASYDEEECFKGVQEQIADVNQNDYYYWESKRQVRTIYH